MNIEDKIIFWLNGSKRSLKVSEELLELKRYLECLFFAHLSLEKLLKSKIIKVTKKDPVYSHDLLILAKDAKLRLNNEQVDFLARINVYNIRTRYQDYKMSLYKQANKSFTQKELKAIKDFIKVIK